MPDLQWLHTSGWWRTRLWGRCRAARCPAWPLPAASAPAQTDAGPSGRALWSARCPLTGSSAAGAAGWQTGGRRGVYLWELLGGGAQVYKQAPWFGSTQSLNRSHHRSHLIWHPRAVCELVPVGDSNDHRWLQEERVTALGEGDGITQRFHWLFSPSFMLEVKNMRFPSAKTQAELASCAHSNDHAQAYCLNRGLIKQ